jgi:hypothetical protein
MQIVILGMHRSGTSAIADLLRRMGAYFGPPGIAIPPNFANPRGFCERADVVAQNDALLEAAGAAWDTPLSYDRKKIAAESLGTIIARMRTTARELCDQPVSIVKDPRMCLTLSDWTPLLHSPACVLVMRNPLAIARSLEKRGDCSIATGIAMWEAYLRAALRQAKDVPLLPLDFENLLTNPEVTLDELLRELKAINPSITLTVPDKSIIAETLDTNLRHHIASRDELADYATRDQLRFFDQLISTPLREIADEPVSGASQQALLYYSEREKSFRDQSVLMAGRAPASIKALAKLQSDAERLASHRTVLRDTTARLMAETEGARNVLLDIFSRPELRGALWLSRWLRRRGATAADSSATEVRLKSVWSAGRDTLENTVDTDPP